MLLLFIYDRFLQLAPILLAAYNMSKSGILKSVFNDNNLSSTTNRLYFILKAWMIPWSIGCKTDVQFGGKKCIFTLLKSESIECPEKLSRNNKTFLSFRFLSSKLFYCLYNQ
jgi:hypothetical protein